MQFRMALAGFLTAAAAALAPVASASAASTFTTPVKLTGPAGGEPSIASDPLGDVFVAGPQGIPSGVNGTPGIGFWVSRNDGTSFGPGRLIGSFLGGGDDDVLFSKGAVYVADLEAVASQICKSTDRGTTFNSVGPFPDPGKCSTVGLGQAGPSADRPWLTADSHGTLYLTYHEFVSAQPLGFRSDDGGQDLFLNPCGSIVTDPSIELNVPTDITGGTLVARPVTDAAGNLYILFATTTQPQNVAAFASGQPSGTFSQLYLAVSHDHCKSFTDYTVFDGSKMGTNTVQFGDIFNDLAIDGAGNLYAIGAGFVGKQPFAKTTNLFLFRSTDHGKQWQGPMQIGGTGEAHMLPAAIGGPRAGQLAIGYFRTTNGVTDPNSDSGKWTYATAESNNATAANPSFTFADVNPGFIYHAGQICNAGILCLPGEPSDRSLLDFTSVTVDPHGCELFTFAGNPDGVAKGTFNYVTRQLTGCFTSFAPARSILGIHVHRRSHHKPAKKRHKAHHKKRHGPKK
jgi:hypothetical protein